MKSSARRVVGSLFCLAAIWLLWSASGGAQPAPQKLRILGPDVLQRGTRHLLHIEGLLDGKTWQRLAPDLFTVKITGAARALDDPAGKSMNPVEILCEDVAQGKVAVVVRSANQVATRVFAVGTAPVAGVFEAALNPAQESHRFMGMGGGVLFYDNQFDISTSEDLYDWCFRDVRTSLLHVLIRSWCLPQEPADDWRQVDLARFDFSPLQRPFRIIKEALKRNPDLKIYASLYSPPAWMKSNNSTTGQGTLKDGQRYRQEVARYVFAYLKYARQHGILVHYLAFFNEPEYPHTQEGMYFADLGMLVETFRDCAQALDTLIAADSEMKKAAPVYVFPDTLGPGVLTRTGENAKKIVERTRLLDRVGIWGVHDYWHQEGTYRNERFWELRRFPAIAGKPIWMTEWAQRERLGDLASGVEYGSNILNALRLGAEAWLVFEWCHPSGNQSGLISTDWGAQAPRSRYWRSKAYHVFRQVANTTPAGARVLAMTGRWKGTSQANGHGVEYLALREGERVIVHLQNTEPAPVSYRLAAGGKVSRQDAWITTPLLDMVPVDTKQLTISHKGNASTLSGVLAGNSLLSLVLEKNKTP